jgi:hypothetical protein
MKEKIVLLVCCTWLENQGPLKNLNVGFDMQQNPGEF